MSQFPVPDWSTAMVVPEAGGFELQVRFVGNIPEDWRETCNELAKQGAPQGGAWREMTLSGDTLVVSGLQDDAQEALKAFVTGLVALTSETVVAHREAAREAAAEKVTDDATTQQEAAQTLTDWFRSDT